MAAGMAALKGKFTIVIIFFIVVLVLVNSVMIT